MRMRVVLLVTLCMLGSSVSAPAHAYVPEKTPRRDLEASARRALSHRAARGATPAVVFMRGGRLVYGRNPDRPMLSASLVKLITTTSAMVRFGPDHRFATRVLVSRSDATLPGLYLVGGGDPTLSTEAYRRNRFEPKPTDFIRRPAFASGSPTVEQLAARIARAGVRSVAGPIVVDDSRFDARRVQQGWAARYLTGGPDVAYLSALTVDEGRADLDGETLHRDPARAAGEALARALRARGISVLGEVVRGRAPSATRELARVESPPVAEIVDFINRYSVNFEAEILLKNLGASFGGAGSTAAAVRVVHEVLSELDVPTTGLILTDGSGLSLVSRVTPRTFAALLEKILTQRGPGWDALRASIPVAGEPGTLLRRLRRPPTGGNLRGKTGLLRGVRAMAGWVTPPDGVPIVYVAVFNGAASASALTAPLDLIGTQLARYPDA